MNDLGNTVIENFNTFPPSNTWLDWIKILATPFATLVIGLFTVYITVVNLRRTMLDNLDSKSGWRKTLFEISGKDKITLEDVFKLRACLRFDKKENATNIFDKKTNEMIDFCNDMKTKYDNKYSCESEILFYSDREKVRIYSRYLLANHWEILQLSKREYKKYEKEKNSSYVKQVKPSKKWYKKEQDLEERTDQLIKDLTP
ncbi:hypothetical protein [Staphylococcus xylosus]|uniref:hypothetical protein n=1 Tax=Staphylococcus xylosus TaxID=1288 RepID=UPI0008536224|nr:hypothetical protein [Staphylococcus xylosus]OEK78171.1 hypothetical protein AST16_09350 [Staphylococcus xylosus]